jgi:hypothetical protein
MRHLDGGLGVPDAGGGCLEDHGPVVVLLRTGAPAVEVKRMKRACLGCNRLCRHEKPGANLMITIFVAVIKFGNFFQNQCCCCYLHMIYYSAKLAV